LQYYNIDIACFINKNSENIAEKYIIVIEDKTFTKNHSGQLKRYKETIEELHKECKNIRYIYYKTEDQSSYKEITDAKSDAKYKLFLRKDILGILNQYKGNNLIVCSYRDYLQNIENEYLSYKTQVISQFKGRGWYGFYQHLVENLKISKDYQSWGYVPNARGGFYGLWFDFTETNKGFKLYLQCECQNDGTNVLRFRVAKLNKIALNTAKSEDMGINKLTHQIEYRLINNEDINFIYNIKNINNIKGQTASIITIESFCGAKNDIIDIDKTIKIIQICRNILKQSLEAISYT
jgi:hypothetical protein